MVALLSDIEVWAFVTVIPVAPILPFTCSGLSSNPASSRSTKGRGIIDRVVVVDSALPILLPHPAIRTQMTATASAAVGWRMCSSPFQPCPTDQRGAMSPTTRHVKKWCSNAADAYVKLTVFLGNDERCFLITIGGSSTALSGSAISATRCSSVADLS
jgi:hypothetical protein